MPRLSNAARVTARNNAVWVTCPRCDTLSPVPTGETICDECAARRYAPVQRPLPGMPARPPRRGGGSR
jgi:hypothetical protein